MVVPPRRAPGPVAFPSPSDGEAEPRQRLRERPDHLRGVGPVAAHHLDDRPTADPTVRRDAAGPQAARRERPQVVGQDEGHDHQARVGKSAAPSRAVHGPGSAERLRGGDENIHAGLGRPAVPIVDGYDLEAPTGPAFSDPLFQRPPPDGVGPDPRPEGLRVQREVGLGRQPDPYLVGRSERGVEERRMSRVPAVERSAEHRHGRARGHRGPLRSGRAAGRAGRRGTR
jgi:hypothetical protein